jgi:hypothetical protein
MADTLKHDDIATMVIRLLQDKPDVSPEMIRDKVRALGLVADIRDPADIEAVARIVETRMNVWLKPGDVIEGEQEHDNLWYRRLSEDNWKYWKNYRQHLEYDLGLSSNVLTTLGEETLRTLGLLSDPQQAGSWSRRGMVIGHVQSGKTANYLGLISRAADSGYRVIIIIAGIHNNLRTQTQRRTDEGFIGKKSESPAELTGVGNLNSSRDFPITLTTTQSDFTVKTANSMIAGLDAIRTPLVFVVKKNASVLKRLHKWLKDLNAHQATGQIMEHPLLIIDDEADNASINTNEPELDPTKINGHIRSILKLFRKNCYVGYTATPFANIFIDPEATSEAIDQDLFPSDFIHCLEAPTDYAGAERIFGGGNLQHTVINLDDIDGIIPPKHKKDLAVTTLPQSLSNALGTFIVAGAIRLKRGQNKHQSMLVNVSPYQHVQRQVRDLLAEKMEKIKDAVRYSHALSPAAGLKQPELKYLKDLFDRYYGSLEISWKDILPFLNEAADKIKVRAINSGSADTLDYQAYQDRGETLHVVAVGGYALSRGLTLEGLMVSYISRSTKMYDTLMQMGRWFGYRPGYADICRIWMGSEMQRWYGHITQALEELRQQIKQMARDGRTPRDFALYVQTSPDALLITAANKMRHTHTLTVKTDYSGRLKETDIVSAEPKVTLHNLEMIKSFHNSLENGSISKAQPPAGVKWRKSDVWREVPKENIEKFLDGFHVHSKFLAHKSMLQNYLRHSDLPLWDIVFIRLENGEPDKEVPWMNVQRRTLGGWNPQSDGAKDKGWSVGDNKRVAGTGDERLGLLQGEIEKAEAKASSKKSGPTDMDYRNARGRPLLMIHLLQMEKNGKTVENGERVPAFGMSFPGDKQHQRPVEYVFNKTLAEQLDWLNGGLEEGDIDFDRDTAPMV